MALAIPGYQILRTLGRGGMATVYLAQQDIFERKVALKVMSKALADDEAFGKRFFREAKIVSQLVHPNIVTVYDVGLEGGNYFLSMEYIDGRDLKQMRKTLSLQEKINAVIDIARALKYAGDKGYVHRDIKPENILFHSSDGRAVLTDFGIARAAETDVSMTQTGLAIGTPHYMSPEQAKGKPVDSRSDIYSLGVVFFLLLTGRVPFDAESAVAIGIKHITETVPLLPEGMAALQPIIDTLLAKKAGFRYQDGDELIDDLERIDIALLEQSIAYEVSSVPEVDCESPTEEGPPVTDADLALMYSDSDERLHERGGCTPWLVGLLIMASLVAWVFYYQRPDIAGPWLEQGKATVERYYDKALMWYESATSDPVTSGPSAIHHDTPAPSDVNQTLQTKSVFVKPRPMVGDIATTSDEQEPYEQPAIATTVPVADVIADIAPVVDITSYESYELQLETLRLQYESDATYLAELVSLHQVVLNDYPAKTEVERSLAALQHQELEAISDLLATARVEAAVRKLQQVKALFVNLPIEQIRVFDTEITHQQTVTQLLSKADQYHEHNQLTHPKGHNALTSYREVLALSPKNAQAIKGVALIAGKLVHLAQKAYDQERLAMAKSDIERALEANPSSIEAQKLRDKIEAALQHQRDVRNWLARARSRMDTQDYYSPQNDSAYHYYQMVLALEAANTQAITGQKQMLDRFARNIWGLVGNEQFTLARRQLAQALQAEPSNKRLLSLSDAVEEVLADKAP